MITIEEIQGRKYTVIRKPFDAEWVREQLAIGMPVWIEKRAFSSYSEKWHTDAQLLCNEDSLNKIVRFEKDGSHEVLCSKAILPPLPRKPKPSDAWLLHLYAAHGVIAYSDDADFMTCLFLAGGNMQTITHALHNGERVDVAIEEGE